MSENIRLPDDNGMQVRAYKDFFAIVFSGANITSEINQNSTYFWLSVVCIIPGLAGH
jgi:hypothetical protein